MFSTLTKIIRKQAKIQENNCISFCKYQNDKWVLSIDPKFSVETRKYRIFLAEICRCSHRLPESKKILTFWEHVWTLKNTVFSWVHRKYWSIRQNTLIILIFAERNVVYFVDFCLYSKYWTYTVALAPMDRSINGKLIRNGEW